MKKVALIVSLLCISLCSFSLYAQIPSSTSPIIKISGNSAGTLLAISDEKCVTVYELIVANGIINLVILLIFAIFDYNFGWLDNYNDYFNNFNSTELLVALGVIITQFGLNLFILISNKSNSPCHIFIIFIFGQLSFYLNFSGISILILFFLIIILFCSCIFNEIIELNFCGQKTLKEI